MNNCQGSVNRWVPRAIIIPSHDYLLTCAYVNVYNSCEPTSNNFETHSHLYYDPFVILLNCLISKQWIMFLHHLLTRGYLAWSCNNITAVLNFEVLQSVMCGRILGSMLQTHHIVKSWVTKASPSLWLPYGRTSRVWDSLLVMKSVLREVVGSHPGQCNSMNSFSSCQETGRVFSSEVPLYSKL